MLSCCGRDAGQREAKLLVIKLTKRAISKVIVVRRGESGRAPL